MSGNCENLATKAELNKLRNELESKFLTKDRDPEIVKAYVLPLGVLAAKLFNTLGALGALYFGRKAGEKVEKEVNDLFNKKGDKAEIEALEKRVSKNESNIDKLFSEIEKFSSKIESFRTELENRFLELFGLYKKNSSKITDLEKRVFALETSQKLQDKQIQSNTNKANKAIDIANEARGKANQAIDKANQAIEDANKAFKKATIAIDEALAARDRANYAVLETERIEKRLEEILKATEILREFLQQVLQGVAQLGAELSQITSQLGALKQADKQLTKRIDALEKEIAKLKNLEGVDQLARNKANEADKKAGTALKDAGNAQKSAENARKLGVKNEGDISQSREQIKLNTTRTITLTSEVIQLRNQATKQGQNITNINQNITNITETVNIPQQFQQQLKQTNTTTKQLLTLTNSNTAKLTAIEKQTQPQAQKTNVKTGICESTQGGCLSNALNPILDGIGDLLGNQCPDLSLPDIAGSLTVECNGETLSFPYSGNGILGLESLMNALHQAQNACPDNQEQPPLVLAIPESWGQLVEANRPQLNVVYFYQDPEFPDKRSFWNLSIPHYKLSEVNTTKQLFPSYRKGNKMGVATLSDNSKIIVNGFDETNVNRVLDVLQMLVSKPVVDRRISHTNRQLSTEFVIPYKASFYPNGRQDAYTKKKLQPEWEKLFEEI